MPLYTFKKITTNEQFDKAISYEELQEYVKQEDIQQVFKLNMFRYSDNNGEKDQFTDWAKSKEIKGDGGFKTYGKATIYSNEDANEENKRPNLSGSIEVTEDIPKGTMLRIAGWINKQGEILKSVGLSLSSKVGGESDSTYDHQKAGKSYTADVDTKGEDDEDLPF